MVEPLKLMHAFHYDKHCCIDLQLSIQNCLTIKLLNYTFITFCKKKTYYNFVHNIPLVLLYIILKNL